MADPTVNVGTQGPLSIANANGLITFDPQQAAVQKYAQRPAEPPVSVNAWTHEYDQPEKGRIVGNVVI